MFTLDFNGKPYIKADNAAPLFFIAGPCAMESRAHALEVSAALKEIFVEAGIPFLYKSSFDKANRSSGAGFRGVGMKEGLSILAEVRESRDVPVLTDIHTAEQAAP
ncbi:MAG: 3-deoxy-8-phosphooctulonate synthase, partial [Mailhella sp.]|nr:3-deoxy-8-phosphooctulonate synthase [Mailhella sp.]